MMKKYWWVGLVGLVGKVIGAIALPEVFRSSFRWQVALHMRMCGGEPGEGEPTGYYQASETSKQDLAAPDKGCRVPPG